MNHGSPIGRVRSIHDIPYEIKPNTAFHPALREGAIERIRTKSPIKEIGERLSEALEYYVSDTVWAVIIEDQGRPLYVAQNLALSRTTLPYRRVLCVQLNDTYSQVDNTLMTAEYDP